MSTLPVPVITSIAPGHLDKQQGAISSWLSLGFPVISVNVPEEIEQLAPLYPEVRFSPVSRDARAIAGKPLVYIDDLLASFRQDESQICALMNSDIHLTADEGFIDFIRREAEGTLLFGSRVDVHKDEPTGEWIGGAYGWGFDIFFFDRRLLNSIPPSSFCLGLPWWDYWLQVTAIRNGITPKYLQTPVAHHYRHKANYSPDIWFDLGIAFTEYLDVERAGKLRALASIDKKKLDVALHDVARQVLRLLREKSLVVRYEPGEKLPRPYVLDNYLTAQQLSNTGRTAEALELLNQVIAADPGHALAYNALGFLALKAGDKQKALELAEKALSLDPANADIRKNIAGLYAMLGRHQDTAELREPPGLPPKSAK